MSKVTKQDFETFKTYVTKWQNILGLIEWNIYFDRTSDSVQDVYARCYWDMGSHLATVQFCNEWDDLREKTDLEIEVVALHEVLHILTAELISNAEARFTTQSSIDIAEHSIIRRLETVLLRISNAKV